MCLAAAGTLPSVAGAVVSVAPCGATGVLSSNSGTDTCTYAAGATDNFNVPAGITQVSITAVGGKGGNGDIFTASRHRDRHRRVRGIGHGHDSRRDSSDPAQHRGRRQRR